VLALKAWLASLIYFFEEVEFVAQLPRLPGGIMSSRYCLCSCSAACRWISII